MAYVYIIEGSSEVKLRQYGEMEKQMWEESERRRQEVEDQRRGRVRRKKMQLGEKVGKSQLTPFFSFSNDLWLRRVAK